MIGHYIANTIMLSRRMTFEESKTGDMGAGFVQCFEDYKRLWERHDFEIESDDAVIRGEYIVNNASSGPRKKVCIICHGLTAVRAADIKYGKLFYDKGYNLVIFDERYFGESTGPYCTLGLKESNDIKKIIEFTKSLFGEDIFLGLHGESMGASTALFLLDSETPDFVVADCPFSDAGLLIDDLALSRAGILGPLASKNARRIGIKRYDYDFRSVRPIDSVKNSNVPICFMHGDSDTLIDCKHSEEMFKLCKNPLSELHLFEHSNHARSIYDHPDDYKRIMLEFVEKIEKGTTCQ